ncbi:MAG: glutamine amidotransferase-related protein [Patescibacteria group bacterium]|jgi:GMP synthase (glutamine-hydrolysing)
MRILLIQYRTDASAEHEYRCVTTHGRLDETSIHRVNPVLQPGTLRTVRIADYDAVVFGGSGEFSAATPGPIAGALDEARFVLDDVLATDHPFFGMCFGHQVLARHLGARVVTDPNESQVGSHPVRVTVAGQADRLFADVPAEFIAQHGHKDAVIDEPAGAIHLAEGYKNRMGAYRIGQHVYATQFHPELTKADLVHRLTLYPEYLKGRTLEEASAEFRDSHEAVKVLRNFVDGIRPRPMAA